MFALQAQASQTIRSAPMGEVIRFVPKSELERARLIREARANYERVFPPADNANDRQEPKK
jgi:hypothetical protein